MSEVVEMNDKEWPTLYRFEDAISPAGVTITCDEFTVVGETPACYYVMRKHDASMRAVFGDDWGKKRRKRVLKDQHGKRYCYTDKRLALESYKVRKFRQNEHATLAKERAEAGYAEAIKLLEAPGPIEFESVVCAGGDYIRSLSWYDW